MLFAQISGKDSLREIENALLANHKRLYHLGMEAVAKSTLSEAMNRRNPEIFKALFEELLDRVMAVAPKHKFKFKNPLYAIDSTMIDLCLSRYNWAYYRKHVMSQIWVAMIHYLLIAYLKFLHGFKLGMTELTNRIRDTLMQNQSLLEVLSLDRKILEKPPNWNLPVQEELFSPLLL